jgi:predicted dehydrogenase
MEPIRYAVVGLGYIAQVAVLPAFAYAKNSRLTAFVSGDPVKLAKLARKYGVENNFAYEDYDDLLGSGIIDAVYIALPNSLHYEYARRALERGIHVLCEKPLTTVARDAEELVRVADENRALLMTAYRLHFQRANLEAAEIVRSGKIGEPRFFNSSFSMQLTQGNIRADKALGGGPLYDLGVYCINAARYFFREEPEEVFAFSSRGHDRRFAQVDEMSSAILRFPGGRLAQFACSFGASPVTWCEVVGTKGSLRLTNAYEYVEDMELEVKHENGKTESKTFVRRDQFAPELIHFSECIQKGRKPKSDGREGLADVRVIEALLASAKSGRPQRPRLPMKARRPRKPALVHAHPASRD